MLSWRTVRPLITAAALLIVLAFLDFITPHGSWYSSHPMTSAVVSTVVIFVALSVVAERWLHDREAARLHPISTVAYRSLAQYINDAGRSLVAPLTGADLFALAIPTAHVDDARAVRARLAAHGIEPSFNEVTGSWRSQERGSLEPTLRALASDPDFVRGMFRATAAARRRLQEATALWAPVMLTSAATAEDLGRVREVSDALELLQERWRLSGLVGTCTDAWEPRPGWLEDTVDAYFALIACYEAQRDRLGDLAALPSDAIVRRR